MHPLIKTLTWFKQGAGGGDYTGRMELSLLEASLPISAGAFYLCGAA
ncbi:hypothetical protein [Pseudoalteromonas sp. S1608]|nr:hypothetical protein [Pseudoalteromonas sp. S1608]